MTMDDINDTKCHFRRYDSDKRTRGSKKIAKFFWIDSNEKERNSLLILQSRRRELKLIFNQILTQHLSVSFTRSEQEND